MVFYSYNGNNRAQKEAKKIVELKAHTEQASVQGVS
jgi:hypothetical protein